MVFIGGRIIGNKPCVHHHYTSGGVADSSSFLPHLTKKSAPNISGGFDIIMGCIIVLLLVLILRTRHAYFVSNSKGNNVNVNRHAKGSAHHPSLFCLRSERITFGETGNGHVGRAK
jgi:hypothetical protein